MYCGNSAVKKFRMKLMEKQSHNDGKQQFGITLQWKWRMVKGESNPMEPEMSGLGLLWGVFKVKVKEKVIPWSWK